MIINNILDRLSATYPKKLQGSTHIAIIMPTTVPPNNTPRYKLKGLHNVNSTITPPKVVVSDVIVIN